MKFSIIIVTSNRHRELFDCLDSILKCKINHNFEVIVIFNGDRSYFEKCTQTYRPFSTYFIHKTTPSEARNFGIRKAQGEYFLFLDDDLILPENYFSNVDFELNWHVLGGPDQTPPNSSSFQKVIGEALSSPLCTGFTFKRHTNIGDYNTNADERCLILCNLWIKASVFREDNFGFNPLLYRNEENYLLKELKIANKVLHYSPQLFVYHQRKENLEKLAAAIIKSGECRVQNFSILPKIEEIYYTLPLLWSLLLLWVLFNPQSSFMNLFIYYALAISLQGLIRHQKLSLRYVALHFFILGAYSIGLMRGLYLLGTRSYTNLRENKSLIKESNSK